MANIIYTEYKEMLDKAINSDADLAAGRKAALVSTVAMVSSRVLLFVTGALSSYMNDFSLTTMDVVTLLVAFIFGRLIYTGFMLLAVLALIGGFMSVAAAWQNESLFDVFSYGNAFDTAYGVSFIIAVTLTIVPMAYLLLNPKYRKYADELGNIKREISKNIKSNSPAPSQDQETTQQFEQK